MVIDADEHPLALWRIEQGLSQAAFADRLGVTQATVSRWEWGEDFPSKKHMSTIHRLTGIAPIEFYEFAL